MQKRVKAFDSLIFSAYLSPVALWLFLSNPNIYKDKTVNVSVV